MFNENQLFSRSSTSAAGLEADSFQAEQATGERLNLLCIALPRSLEANSEQALSKSRDEFASAHHLDIVRDGNQFVYRLQADGKTQTLFATEASANGLEDANKKLQQQSNDLQRDLQDKYKVSFAAPGEDIDTQRNSAESSTRGSMIKSRAAEFYELVGIRAALEKAGSSSLTSDGKTGIKIYFPEDKLITELSSLATYQRDRNDRPSIYLYRSDLSYITENDLSAEQRALPFTERQRPETMEGMIVHEIGHHQLDKLGYNKTPSGEKLFEEMGWVHRVQEKNQLDDWLLKGKSKDVDGKNASYFYSWEGLFAKWTQWSVDKGPMDGSGHPVRAQDAQSFSEDEIRKEALVPPASWYFENPEEEYAEAFRIYKLGSESRAYLHKTSPALFSLVEKNCAGEELKLLADGSW